MNASRVPLLAASLALISCSTDPVQAPVRSFEFVTSLPASVVPGTRFDSVVVRLVDVGRGGVAGVPVTFSGDGTVEPYDAVTNGNGYAAVRWTLPRTTDNAYAPSGLPGDFRLHAQVAGHETATLDAAAYPFQVDRLAVGSSYACGIREGELWCWGSAGWIGGRSPVRYQLPGTSAVVEVSVAVETACALTDGGKVWCRRFGSPQFAEVAAAQPLRSVAAGAGEFCGLDAAGFPWCWSVAPTAAMQAERLAELSLSSLWGSGGIRGFYQGTFCGLDSAGEVWCWGDNRLGQFGSGSAESSAVPVPGATGHRFKSLAVGRDGSCGVKDDNSVWCWGDDMADVATTSPRRVTIPGVVGPQIAAGTIEGYAITASGVTVWRRSEAWLFDPITAALRIVEVSAQGQACVRSVEGYVYCSWILVRGGGDTSILPSSLVPVPRPIQQ